MSASPFRTTPAPFLETPLPTPRVVEHGLRPLEDVPFGDLRGEEDDPKEAKFKPDSEAPLETGRPTSFFGRLMNRRRARYRREQMLEQELQDLRASYAGLLHATNDIRERFDIETESRQSVQKALSPFPAAVLGIEAIQTRQEEAGEILLNIRERLVTTADRDEEVMASLGFLTEGVNSIQSGVGKVDERIGSLAEGQAATTESLGNLGTQIESRLEEVKLVTRESGERFEQSSEDVLNALRKIEASSQRGLWIFASLLGAIVVALICFAAAMGQMKSEPATPLPTTPAAQESASGVSTDVSTDVSTMGETAVLESAQDETFGTIILDDDHDLDF